MIYYKVLNRITPFSDLMYYLRTDQFKYKRTINVLDPFNSKWFVYKDVYASCPESKLNTELSIIKEDLFTVLDYKGVERFFERIQTYNKELQYAKIKVKELSILLENIERTLLYWDDYN